MNDRLTDAALTELDRLERERDPTWWAARVPDCPPSFLDRLIAAARPLIDEVRELRAENARLRTDIDLLLKPSGRDGDIPAQARAWQATWTALDRAGIYSFWCDSMRGVDRATGFIAHLAAENARLQEELKLWRPLTPEEAEEAYAKAEAVPMSEEEISRIMEKVLDPAYSAPNNEAAQMAVEIERLRAELAAMKGAADAN